MYTTIIIGAWFLLCGWRGLRDTPKPGVLPGLWSLVFFLATKSLANKIIMHINFLTLINKISVVTISVLSSSVKLMRINQCEKLRISTVTPSLATRIETGHVALF